VLSRAILPTIVSSYTSVSAIAADRFLLSAQLAATTVQTLQATLNRSWDTVNVIEYDFINASGDNLPMSNSNKPRSTHVVLATTKNHI